jgi:squalene monooxygenase
MTNRSMPASPYPTPGALLMGDAFNMRHPLTGGGMTVALSDIVLVRDLLRPLNNLNDASSLCNYLESFYTLRKVRQAKQNPNKPCQQKTRDRF